MNTIKPNFFIAALAVLLMARSGFSIEQSEKKYSRIAPKVVTDLNTASDVVEISLQAGIGQIEYLPGVQSNVWNYNGTIPGPMIEAKVGDLLIVNFSNALPEETTVHWHGLELPANMDGSHISQLVVPAGGSFRYEFRLLRPGLFWYHPHVRTNAQVELGLHGALLVHDPDENKRLNLPSGEHEHVLVLDDVLLDSLGVVADPFPSNPIENALTQVNGRIGNHLLVNGHTALRDTIKNGVPHRLRVVNVSNSRFMRLALKGQKMWRIGGDGGLLETPIEILPIGMVVDTAAGHGGGLISDPDPSKGLILTPGERADLVFSPTNSDSVVLEWHDWVRGRHSASLGADGKTIMLGHSHWDGTDPLQNLAVFYLEGQPAVDEYAPPAALRIIMPIDTAGAATIVSPFGHTMPDSLGNLTFFVQMKDGKPLPMPMVSADDAPKVTIGNNLVWEVHNMTAGDHNFHLHGFRFQLLESEFVDLDVPILNEVIPAPYLEDKDTIFLPKRRGAMGRSRSITRLAVLIDDSGREGQAEAYGKVPTATTSGGWLFHCHILEHSNRGMMSFLQVFNTSTSVADANLQSPAAFELEQNYPNPFNPETTIRYAIYTPGRLQITIHNTFGQAVRTLVDEQQKAGHYQIEWDGSNYNGARVASGAYFYTARLDGKVIISRRMLLLK